MERVMFGSINPTNLLSSVAGLALGGPAGLFASQIAQGLFSSILQSAIGSLNLPTFLQNALQNTVQNTFGPPLGGTTNFHGLIDQLADAFGANFFQRGMMHQQAQTLHDNMANWATFMMRQMEENQQSETSERPGRSEGGSGGWIRAMAEQMGRILDEAWHEAEALAKNIDKEDPSTSAEYQGAIQEFNFIMQAFSTAIKAAGEGSKAMASRQ
jgi:hypothetical protein